MRDSDEQEIKSGVLGDNTHIKLGFVIGLLALVGCGLGGAIWWAATISADMKSMLAMQAASVQVSNNHQTIINDLQVWKSKADDYLKKVDTQSEAISKIMAWKDLVDTVGTKAMMTKSAELEKQMNEISRQFEVHKLSTKP